jgi:exodeoxyribonuclease VIII
MGWIQHISNEDYHHGDELKEHFSSSNIKAFMRSPAHCHYAKNNPDDPTPAMIFGEIFHAVALEPDRVVEMPPFNLRKKAEKAQAEAWRAANADKVVATAEQFKQAEAMTDSIMHHRLARALMEADGEVEVSGVFNEPTYGIKGKLRVDKLNRNDHIMIDLKSTVDASDEYFSKAIFNFGYHISGSWYNVGGHCIDKVSYEFILIAVEKTPPFAVNVFRLTERHFEIAYRRIDAILDSLNRCIESDKWPAYPQRIVTPDIPAWEFKN